MMSPRPTPTDLSRVTARRGRLPRPVIGTLAVCAAAAALATAATPAVAADVSVDSGRSAAHGWSPFFAQVRPIAVVDARHVVITFADPSLGSWEAASPKPLTVAQRRAWLAEAGKLQQQRLDALAAAGVQFSIEHRYLRVVNGVSIVVHGDGAELARGVHGVAQVVPVRTVWPAEIDPAGVSGAAAAAGGVAPAAGAAEGGVRVAVLDAGVDAAHPAVRGHLDGTAFDAQRSDGAPQSNLVAAEAHGTAVAGAVLRGAGGGTRVALRDIRVLGARPTRDGSEAVLGDSDDVIAGLEHAVDPNADGNFADGAQV
ncbi:MAG: hypothetical protein JWN41_714, partial [Thermoleophilia bacterium]|nr:hypothetical protein [Thermoleophilia bacterium]